jgi:hypothetical protein
MIGIFLVTQYIFLTIHNSIYFGYSVSDPQLNIAVVKPTFTAAAYIHNPPAFYDFYHKYDKERIQGKNVIDNVNYLTSKIPKESSLYHPEIFGDLPSHIKDILPNAKISIISDADVHKGAIFKKNNSGQEINAYDILLLGVNEYVTQQEYDNLKKFVSNGGTLMVLTGGILYAEVRYDEATNSVTLVKGHKWAFDGKVAHGDVGERWENETRQWLGSNLYDHYYYEKDYNILYNNPFNFTGRDLGEEQYYDKNNPNIKVLLNYNSSDPRYPIATYELNYGKGKSIVIGLAAEDIISNPCVQTCQKFFKLIDNLLINHALPSHMSSR